MNYPTLLIASALLGQSVTPFQQAGPYYGGVFIATNWPSVIQPQPPLATNWVEFGNPAYELGLVSDGGVVWRSSFKPVAGILTNTISQSVFTLSATNVVSAISDEAILNLIKSGEVCRVIGHKWNPGCGMVGCIVAHYGPMRHCAVCSKSESQEIGEWK